jgi:chromosomal replication initiator protein
MDVWDQVKQLLAQKLSAEAFQNWIARTKQIRLSGTDLVVAVPNSNTRLWIEQEYAEQVWNAISTLQLPVQKIAFELSADIPHVSGLFSHEPPTLAPAFNNRFTFESFVVGACNQFAHAAAQAVAEAPAKRYNPLFIYSGVGMGKTHLIHAIGRALLARDPEARVVYTTSERFMNQMILAVKAGDMSQFHRTYRQADALLIDDIHILGGKERTQEEFFHTFNELYDHQKQIVISSDSAPKLTAGIVERLRSRFEWGLLVDMQPPDLETKLAILDKKAEQEGIAIPEDVAVFIATKTKTNVRELEGALIKLVAYSSVTGAQINLPMAQRVLKYLVPTQEKRVTMDAILRTVAERYHLQPSQLKQKTNARSITEPRQIAMYLMKELTHASYPEIGRIFGGKHHTTVLHSVHKIEALRQKDPDLNRSIHSLIDSIH